MINHSAIYALYPNVVTIRDITAYDKDNNVVQYDIEAVDAWIDPSQYRQQRAAQYPAIADQLDMLWHAIDSGSLDKNSDFYKSLKAVKDANPKG